MTSKINNIPTKLKKYFKANIIIKYDFGNCYLSSKIKQNGDWKDHIFVTKDGKILRSLNVKLMRVIY